MFQGSDKDKEKVSDGAKPAGTMAAVAASKNGENAKCVSFT